MKLELRPYQRQAIDAIYDYFASASGNPLVVVPTGGGKSLILADFIRGVLEQWPDQRILILTHVKELIQQNFVELMNLWPDAPAGIHSAGLNRRDIHSRIIFGGIQSIHRRAFHLQRVDLVLVDEAHLIPRASGTRYCKFLNELREINPYIKIIGLTATPFRLDSGMLHRGNDAIFTDIAHEVSIRKLIDDGYLSRPVSLPAMAQIDTSDVGTRGGEFIPGQLEAAALDPKVTNSIADEIVRNGDGRQGWLVFGCGVAHATALRDALRARGVSCEGIFGDTAAFERDFTINRFKRREIMALSSVGVLTTGFNARHVDLIALARPTKSKGLYQQIAGRGLRLSPETGKENCLFLDFGGNIERHGPLDDMEDRSRRKGASLEGAPTKDCPECGASHPIAARECGCGFEFPAAAAKISTTASSLDVLTNLTPQWLDVSEVTYARHEKMGKPPSVCVTYRCGLVWHREWQCPEHTGYPRQKFVSWWQRRAPASPVPNSVDEALSTSHALVRPSQIAVRPAGKYFEIVGAKLG